MATRKCARGTVYRKSYTRKRSSGKRVHVKGACISDVGAPGKGLRSGPGIGPLRKGDLTKFGYSGVTKMPASDRHVALRKAVGAYGWQSVVRKLNAVAVYTRRVSPHSSKLFKDDMKWVQVEFGKAKN